MTPGTQGDIVRSDILVGQAILWVTLDRKAYEAYRVSWVIQVIPDGLDLKAYKACI